MASTWMVVCVLVVVSFARGSDADACPDVMADVQVCEQQMASAGNLQSLEEICRAGRQYLSCAEEIQARCGDSPHVQAMQVSVDYFRDYLHTQLNCPPAVEGSLTPESEDSEDSDSEDSAGSADNVVVECPPSQAAFNHTLYQCFESALNAPPAPGQMCQLLGQAVSCGQSLTDACQDSVWMTGLFRRSVEEGLSSLRMIGDANGCSGL